MDNPFYKDTPQHKDHQLGEQIQYNYISDGFYIGTNECCNLGVASELLDKGVTVDISLEEGKVDSPFGIDAYIWLPIVDDTPPTEDQMDFAADVIKKLVEQKKTVYLHCLNGHGRSTTIFMGYLMKHKGMGHEEAFKFIKEKRPGVHLSDSQYEFIMNYENNLEK